MQSGSLNYKKLHQFSINRLKELCHRDPAYLYQLSYFAGKNKIKRFLKLAGLKHIEEFIQQGQIPSNYHEVIDRIFEKNNFKKLIKLDRVSNFALYTIPQFYLEYLNACKMMKPKTTKERFIVYLMVLSGVGGIFAQSVRNWTNTFEKLENANTKNRKTS